jgi:alpha-1,6-mannosyltransferase
MEAPVSAPSRARSAPAATVAVVATAALVGLVASTPGSPFTPPLFPGARAPGILEGAAGLLGLDALSRDGLAVLGAAALFVAAGAFLYALGAAWRGHLSIRRIVVVGILLHLVALAIPLFLSRDVYSYAIYGRMVSEYGENPYTDIPAAFADDPVYPLVSVDWIDSRSVYGPAFTAISAGVTGLFSTPASTVFGFKAMAAVAGVLTMLLTAAAARRAAPERAAFAAALIGWNPVIVFHGVAGGHNDALVGLAVAGAVLLVLLRRELLATAALTVGALVKISAAVPLFVAAAAFAFRKREGQRAGELLKHVGVGVLVALPFVLPFMQAEDPTLGTLELTTRQGWLAPSRFVLVTLRGAANAIGGEVAGDIVSVIVRLAFPLAFVWVLVVLLRHLARGRERLDTVVVLGAMGWASLISLLVSPVLLPWYVAWLIPLAWILPRTARGGAVLISVALAITELVAEPSRAPRVWEAMVFGLHWVATPIILLVLIRLLLELRRRTSMPPAARFDDPLLSDASPPPGDGSACGEPALVAAPAGPGGGRVAGHAEQDDDRHRSGPTGTEAHPVGDEGAQDRRGDPD